MDRSVGLEIQIIFKSEGLEIYWTRNREPNLHFPLVLPSTTRHWPNCVISNAMNPYYHQHQQSQPYPCHNSIDFPPYFTWHTHILTSSNCKKTECAPTTSASHLSHHYHIIVYCIVSSPLALAPIKKLRYLLSIMCISLTLSRDNNNM